MNRFFTSGIAGVLVSVVGVCNAAVINGLGNDAQVSLASPTFPADGGGTVANATSASFAGGRSGATTVTGTYFNTIYAFQLPDLGMVPNAFTTASFSMTIANTNDLDAFDTSLHYDLYGLSARSAPDVLGSDFFVGASDGTDASLIANDFITSTNSARFTANVGRTTAAANLLTYLNTQYAGGANIGQYIFLRINVDKANNNLGGITNYASEAANSAFRPSITYTAVPEPGIGAMILAGLPLFLRRRRA